MASTRRTRLRRAVLIDGLECPANRALGTERPNGRALGEVVT